MDNVVKVIVDLPLKKLNKEFDYLLPENLESEIKIGQIVKVPFGRRKISAFVSRVKTDTKLEKSKLKKIDSLVYKTSFFDQKMLDLFFWIASYYHAYIAQVIKTALPPGITEQKIKKKKVKFLKLNQDGIDFEKELTKLNKRAPKQFLILKYLYENQEKRNRLKEVIDYAETSKQTVDRLIDKNLIILYTNVKERIPKIESSLDYKKNVSNLSSTLTEKEKEIINNIISNKSKHNKYLLQTETLNRHYNIFLHLIDKLVRNHKNIILLIPEIEKDYSFLKQIKNIFKDNVAFLHSKLSKGERFDEWQRIKKGEVQIAVGARSAVFAPFDEIDCIILLEENNENYKQQEHPLYHARQIAAKRLQKKDSIFLLESPFPSVESRHLAEKGIYKEYKFNRVKDKINTEVIDMKNEIENGNLGDLSSDLKDKIADKLDKNQQIMLFLNRRGSANYVICRKCGHVLKCENCDISLNYHQKKDKLSCHYCGFEKEMPDKCPECKSPFISRAGIGTENILEQLKNSFEEAKIARVDSDQKKDKIHEILNSFKEAKIDILVGTSLIIKNNFYKNLNLLAVISADAALNSSDFRSAENNFVLLNQLKNLLANTEESKFLIQSYNPEHYSIQAVVKENQNMFYQKEKEIRKQRNYPPFCRLINIIISGENEKKVEKVSKNLCDYLDRYKNKFVEKLGAVPAVLSKIRKQYRWQIILKFDSLRNREYIIQLIEKIFVEQNEYDSVQIRIDVDPYQML